MWQAIKNSWKCNSPRALLIGVQTDNESSPVNPLWSYRAAQLLGREKQEMCDKRQTIIVQQRRECWHSSNESTPGSCESTECCWRRIQWGRNESVRIWPSRLNVRTENKILIPLCAHCYNECATFYGGTAVGRGTQSKTVPVESFPQEEQKTGATIYHDVQKRGPDTKERTRPTPFLLQRQKDQPHYVTRTPPLFSSFFFVGFCFPCPKK